ncbi:MAG: aminotransferase class I/II-fold pyridoxal phosphate-dependent enzyme [Gammaproteobacteria bacterium]
MDFKRVLPAMEEKTRFLNLAELFLQRVEQGADQPVYHFIDSENKPVRSLTYRQLGERARALAARLQAMNAKGERVILICPPGLDYMVSYWSCLLAGAIAVPAYPPAIGRLEKTLPRIEAIMQDCRPVIALTNVEGLAVAECLADKSSAFDSVEWLDSGSPELESAQSWQPPTIGPGDIAFLQYTSGSTSSPKGVMVSHANLLHNSFAIFKNLEGARHFVSWLPPYHDMGLIGTIIQVVYGGGWGYFMAPTTFLRYPALWLQTISQTGATVSVAPNFGYDHCVNKISDEQIASLDLGRWRHAFSGAEPVRAATLDAFARRFAPVGFSYNAFQPCFGLAEATLQVTGGRPKNGARRLILDPGALEQRKRAEAGQSEAAGIESIACGFPVDSTEVIIVIPETRTRCTDDGIGEIWVNSPSVALGYWNRPEATEDAFHARLAGEQGKTYLRTGDLGFIDAEGELHVTGRIKDVIVLRGRNLYPNDIELVAQSAYQGPGGKAVAFGIALYGREELVVVVEARNTNPEHAADLVGRVRRLLAEAPLDLTPYAVLAVRSGAIPLTSSGKLQRHAAREQFLALAMHPVYASVLPGELVSDGPSEAVDSRNWLDSQLAQANPGADLNGNSPLRDLKLSFPDLVGLLGTLERQLMRRLSVGSVLMNPTLDQLRTIVCGDVIEPEIQPDRMNISSGEARTVQEPSVPEKALRNWLVRHLAQRLDLPEALIDLDTPFASMGLDSVSSVELSLAVGEYLSIKVPETLVWDAPTPRAAAAHLMELKARVHEFGLTGHAEPDPGMIQDEPIAIVGIGCRFPAAPDVEAFWKLLQDGRDAVSLTPPGRWPHAACEKTKSGLPVSEWGGFLDRIDGFEPQFFGLSQREAQRMDPQQRLLLEVSWEALEHAGIDPHALAGTDTGVFVAISHQEYWTLQLPNREDLDIHACTGNAGSIAANRISYLLDLHGPSMAVDTACSGSLVSVHLACESLRRGECAMALAGGVNLMVKPDLNIAFTEAQMLSPRGRCSTFDDSADGYVRGEGCGLIVLQRLSDAIRDRNPVIALINGSAVFHDGRSNGLTAPNPKAQAAVIKRALGMSGLAAQDVDYVEAHGTGTPLGDPIEARVLAEIYGKGRASGPPCLIGSVKTNIGHLESAAGIAGLIKAALSVERGYVPRHLHFNTPNRNMDWTGSGLAVAASGQIWPATACKSRVAGVSSFGFGGTVAHVLVSSPDEKNSPPVFSREEDWQLLIASAREQDSLARQLTSLHRHLQLHPEQPLGDVCFTAARGRAELGRRVGLVAKGRKAMLDALKRQCEQLSMVEADAGALGSRAFCFSGQGSQYLGMAPDLIAGEPEFAGTIAECDNILSCELGHSLFDLLGKATDREVLQDTRIQQPLLYSLQVALARLWMSWGVRPDCLIGHSVGEYAAMQVAGVMSLEEGLRLVYARARAMADQPREGGMLACLGDLGTLDHELEGFRGRLWVAARNSPENRVIAGYTSDLEAFAGLRHGFETRPLRVSNAFHTPLIGGAAESVHALAKTIDFRKPNIDVITNLGGRVMREAPDAEHFARHIVEPVEFQASVSAALALGAGTFIEIGPGRALLNFARVQAAAEAKGIVCLPSLMDARPERQVLLESISKYWTLGGRIDWEHFYQHENRKTVHMPTYPFSRTRHWYEPASPGTKTVPEVCANPDDRDVQRFDPPSTLMESALELFRSQNAVLEQLTAGAAISTSGKPSPAFFDHAEKMHASPAGAAVSLNERAAGTQRIEIERQVKQYLAKIAGCAPNQIGPKDRLNTSLGLDSLMRTELDVLMTKAWPKLAEIDRSRLGDDPTVDELLKTVFLALGLDAANVVSAAADGARLQSITDGDDTASVVPEMDFEQSEAYCALMARLDLINAVGANPYGRIHEGFNSGHAILDGRPVLNFASFNYLSLSNHPEVIEAAKQAIDTYGTSPSATPLLFGETPLHQELEAEIAAHLGTEAAVVFASGHSTSVAVIGHIMGPEDLILHDQYIHDCAIRGSILSGAKRRSFAHDNWEELDRVLTQIRGHYRRVLIIIEGVYSQDGDIGSLPEFIKIKKKHQAMLMIDEAHSIGVLGETGAGAGEYFGVDRRDVDIWMGTLSKGLGSCGGYIASSRNFIRFLKYTTPLLIFSTGITPANAAAALQSIRVLRRDPERVHALQQKFKWFLGRAKSLGFDTGPSFDSPVVPIIVGSWEKAMILSDMLRSKHINVMPIGYPAVEKDKCRLRFFVNFDHSQEELEFALQSLLQVMAELNEKDQMEAKNAESNDRQRAEAHG